MPNYRRYRVIGGTYFFPVNLLERFPNDLLIRHVEILRTVVRKTHKHWPFHIDWGLAIHQCPFSHLRNSVFLT